jgi:hypothetical protein
MNSGSYVDPKFLTAEDYGHVTGSGTTGVIGSGVMNSGAASGISSGGITSSATHNYHAMPEYMQPYSGHHAAAAAAAAVAQSPVYGGYSGYGNYNPSSGGNNNGRESTPDPAVAHAAAMNQYYQQCMPHPLMAAHHMGHLTTHLQLHGSAGHQGSASGNGGRSPGSTSPAVGPPASPSLSVSANGSAPQNIGSQNSHLNVSGGNYHTHSPPNARSNPSSHGNAHSSASVSTPCDENHSSPTHLQHLHTTVQPFTGNANVVGGDGLSSDCSDDESSSPHGGTGGNAQTPVVYPWMRKIHVAGAGKKLQKIIT